MADDKKIAAELESLQGMFDSTEAKKIVTVEDGNYFAQIVSMEVAKSTGGNLQCKTCFGIVDNEKYPDAKVYAFHGLANQEGMAFFKGFCQIIGFALPAKLADLQPAMNDFAQNNTSKYKINVKTKNGYMNVYCNGVAEPEMSEA